MSDELQKKIFEPLFTTKEVGVGSGLGLSITKNIVEDIHKGQVFCHSTQGVGTEFTVFSIKSLQTKKLAISQLLLLIYLSNISYTFYHYRKDMDRYDQFLLL